MDEYKKILLLKVTLPIGAFHATLYISSSLFYFIVL